MSEHSDEDLFNDSDDGADAGAHDAAPSANSAGYAGGTYDDEAGETEADGGAARGASSRVDDDDDVDDLFGEDEEDDDDDEPVRAGRSVGTTADRQYTTDEAQDREDEYPEDEPARPEVVIQTSLPAVGGPRPDNPNLFILKLPNFLNIEPTPFDRSTYAQVEGDAERDDEAARDRQVQLSVENTIRWRHDARKSGQKNSNARLVRWSDGSFSLLLGEEMFDVAVNQLDQHQYLAVQHPREGFVQSRVRFSKVMTFRPQSTHSLTHKKLTLAIANKHKKVTRTKLIATTEDPEKHRQQLEKAENEKFRFRKQLDSKRSSAASGSTRSRRSRHYDDELSDDETRYRAGNRGIAEAMRSKRYEYDSDDDDFVVDDDEDEMDKRRSTKLVQAKSSASKHFSSDDDDEDGDDRGASSGKATARSRSRADFDDDDNDDNDSLMNEINEAVQEPAASDVASRRKRARISDSDED